jgi:hypothetical protein
LWSLFGGAIKRGDRPYASSDEPVAQCASRNAKSTGALAQNARPTGAESLPIPDEREFLIGGKLLQGGKMKTIVQLFIALGAFVSIGMAMDIQPPIL